MREIDRTRIGVKVYTGENAECFLYSNNSGQPCAAGYSGRKTKASFRYRYKNTGDAVNAINEFLERAKARKEIDRGKKIQDKKLQKELFAIVEVGSIFVSSWGYDQTNVDAYQVIEKKGTATVVLREVALSVVPYAGEGSNTMSCDVRPIKDFFLEKEKPFEKRINRFGISMNSYSSASLWDGKRTYYKSWYA